MSKHALQIATPGTAGFIDDSTLRDRLPYSRRTIYNLRVAGKLPYLCLPGSRRVLYHWPTVEAALLRQQKNQPE